MTSRALLATAALFWTLAGCTAQQRPEPPASHGPPLQRTPVRAFAPDPTLQVLVDPYPAAAGPSWLGADVATSIRIDADRYLWLFGDTLLGSVREECANGAVYCDRILNHIDGEVEMIRNSVGIATRAPNGAFHRIVKYWPTVDGLPGDAFSSGTEDTYLWPLVGVRAGAPVLIGANRNTLESGLAPVGNTIVRIANPDDPPEQWRITRHEIPNFHGADATGPSLSWTMAMARVGRHVYLFGGLGSGFDVATALSRVEVDDVAKPAWRPEPEYLQRDPNGALHWTRDFDLERLHPVRGLPGTSETTVQYDPEIGWYSYQLPPLGFDIRLYTAPDLEGPWRDSGSVYQLPAPWSTERRSTCPGGALTCMVYVAYAVKGHPELATAGERVLSYNVNAGSSQDVEEATERVSGFYVPQIIVGPGGPLTPGAEPATSRPKAP